MRKAVFSIFCLLSVLSGLVSYAKTPKYVFYYIGDGMGINHVVNTQLYLTDVLGSKDSLLMYKLPVMSMQRTHSASSRVTDSAAGGTALAIGHKTRNSMLGVDADTVAVNSIAKILFDKGWGVGLVTTDGLDDATPGAFYTHVASRRNYLQIGKDLADSGYQFLAGAGLSAFYDENGKDTGLRDYIEQRGVKIVYGPEGLKEKADKLMVLSTDTLHPMSIGYAIDSIPGALQLEDMTRAGIGRMMEISPENFFMMVEGGCIDHGGHANDGGAVIRDVIRFDNALRLAYDFYLKHPDETLIVVTADHETGGMSLGTNITKYSMRTNRVADQKISKEAFTEHVKNIVKSSQKYSWRDMKKFMKEKLGWGTSFKPTEKETAELKGIFEKMMSGGVEEQETLYATFDGFTARLFEILNQNAGFGFTTTRHTGAPVPVFAVGVGAEKFASFADNTEIPRRILSIVLGVPETEVPL